MKNLLLNIITVNHGFVLYSNNIDGIKEYEKINGEYIKLNNPINVKMFGVYKHSFPCSLTQALKCWTCWKQILLFNRFYHSIGNNKETYIKEGTKFNIFLLPIIYLYCLIDTKKFHKVAFF